MSSKTIDLKPGALLPHDHPMILIDQVISYGDDFLVAAVCPEEGKPFVDEKGNVPAWVGMEYMAQTIGAFAGVQAQLAGGPVRVGFLLGTRAFSVELNEFQGGVTYQIQAKQLYQDNGLSAFECHIAGQEGLVLATAIINTYQPENIADYMESRTQWL